MANFDVVDLDKVLDDFEDDLDGEEEEAAEAVLSESGRGMRCWTADTAQGTSWLRGECRMGSRLTRHPPGDA